MLQIPEEQKAVVSDGTGSITFERAVPIPKLQDDSVLVKTAWVALNPVDYKMSEFATTKTLWGNDFSGTIVSIPSNSTNSNLRIGDRVCGAVFGGNPAETTNGAFSEYVSAPADFLIRLPPLMPMEEAATLGVGVFTAGLALYRSLALPTPDCPATQPFPVLVYGGSTATGTMAIQFLRLSGLTPIVTCSPRSFEFVKARGAAEAFDYNSPSCAAEIREYTSNSLRYALDCITSMETMKVCYEALGQSGGHYTSLDPFPPRLQRMRRDVKPDWIIAWTVFGKAINLRGAFRRPAIPMDRTFALNWVKFVERLLEEGRLKTHPVHANKENGLEGIPDDLNILREHKLSGQKLVVQVSQT